MSPEARHRREAGAFSVHLDLEVLKTKDELQGSSRYFAWFTVALSWGVLPSSGYCEREPAIPCYVQLRHLFRKVYGQQITAG